MFAENSFHVRALPVSSEFWKWAVERESPATAAGRSPMAIAGTAVCAGSWTSPRPGTLGAFRSEYSVVPQSRPPPLAGGTRHRANTEGIGAALSAGVNRRELPSLYLSANEKENRPGTSEIFLYWYVVAMNAYTLLRSSLSKRCDSWNKESELFGCSVVRCLGNSAESIEQALDAMPYRYDRMAAAPRKLRAGDAFELELGQ